MKVLDTTPIAPGIAMYVKGGTLAFIQLAWQETLNELMTSRIGSHYDPTKAYIVNGCINSGSGLNYIISAGSIFYNGEVFLVDAVSFTIGGSNVAEGVIIKTQFIADADPTDFTDGTPRNVHNIRKIVFQPGLAGSGAVDFTNLINLAYKPVGSIGQTVIWNLPFGTIATFFTAGVGSHPLTLGWNIDIAMGGSVAAAYLSGDATFGTLDQVQGSNTHTISANDLPVLNTQGEFATGPGSTVQAYIEIAAAASGKGPMNVNAGSPNNPISLIQKTITKLFITRAS